MLVMNFQIVNDCAGTDPGLPTAGTDPGRRNIPDESTFLLTLPRRKVKCSLHSSQLKNKEIN